jgi:hypothetical protein
MQRAATLALVAAICLPASLAAQGMCVPTERLRSPVDTVRMHAFNQLQRAADDQRRHRDRLWTSFLADSAKAQPELAAALIELLERENARIARAPAGSLSEDYLDGYYMTLKATVGRIGDPRSVDALLGGLEGSGPADAALASFGDVSVPGLIDHFHSTDLGRHNSAIVTLAEMMANRTRNQLSDASAALVQRALLGGDSQPQGVVPISGNRRPHDLEQSGDSIGHGARRRDR